MRITYRNINIGLFGLSVLGMLFAFYLQFVEHLDPCPLCIFQRVGLIAMGMITLVAAIHNPQKRVVCRIYSLLAVLSIGWSTGVAVRHVWLQHLPADSVPACGPGLNYWLDTFPLADVVQKVLHGSGECAKVDWTWLGFSLPHWSLLFFSVLLLINVYLLVRPRS